LLIGTAVMSLGTGALLGLALSGGPALAQGGNATQQSAVNIVDRCCFDLDGGGKNDDGVFSVNLKGDVLLALVYEDPDGNKKFEDKDEIKAATLGNLLKETEGK
jgi:hypothetical protein